MSNLLCGVGPACARRATNDLTHGLQHQAPRRAQKEHQCNVGVLLASQQDAPTTMQATAAPIKEVSSMTFPWVAIATAAA